MNGNHLKHDILGKTLLKEMGFDPNSSISAEVKEKQELSKAATELQGDFNELGHDNKGFDINVDMDPSEFQKAEEASKGVDDFTHTIDTSFGGEDVSSGDENTPLIIKDLKSRNSAFKKLIDRIKALYDRIKKTKNRLKMESVKYKVMEDGEGYTEIQMEEVRDRIDKENEDLRKSNEDLSKLKDEYLNQIQQIKQSLSHFVDKETGTLGERIKNLFREQGVTIVSIMTAFGMTIGFLVEALTGGGSATAAAAASGGGGDTPSGKGGAKEWIKNKLKALAGLLGKLAGKAAAALPGIIGSVVAWILNRAKDAIGWLSQNVWALITGIGVLIYTYFMTRKRGYSI